MGKEQKNKSVSENEMLLTSSKTSAKKKKNTNKKKREFPVFTVFCVVVGLLLAAFITQSVLENTGFYNRQKVVLSIGDASVNALEFTYYYNTTKNYYYNMYSQYGIFTSDTDFTTTQCSFDSTKTWAEWFASAAVENLKQTFYLYNEAVKNGLTLTEDDTASYNEMLANIDSVCTQYSITRESYFAQSYTRGFTEKDFQRLVNIGLLADAQQTKIVDGYSYTDEEKQAYYEEHPTDFNKYTYRSQDFKFTAYTEDSAKTEEENAAAKAAAEDAKKIAESNANVFSAKITTEESFKTEAYNLLTDDEKAAQAEGADPTLTKDGAYSESDKFTWLADAARVPGDTTVIYDEANSKYTVLYFISSGRLEYNLANLKHIQISIGSADTTDTMTDEEKAAATEAKVAEAKAKAEEAYNKYVENGATEEAFSALVADYSSDTNTVEKEGLLENVKKGSYGDAFDSWVFSADRQAGDCTTIQTASAFELVFFKGTGIQCWLYDTDSAMKNSAWEAYIKELATKYESGLVYNESYSKLLLK